MNVASSDSSLSLNEIRGNSASRATIGCVTEKPDNPADSPDEKYGGKMESGARDNLANYCRLEPLVSKCYNSSQEIQNRNITSTFDESASSSYEFVTDGVLGSGAGSKMERLGGELHSENVESTTDIEPQAEFVRRRLTWDRDGADETNNEADKAKPRVKVFNCDRCCSSFDNQEDFSDHFDLSSECSQLSPCYMCSFSADRLSTLKLHLAFEHNLTEWCMCHHCSRILGSKTSLREHIASQHEPENNETVQVANSANLTSKIKIHSEVRKNNSSDKMYYGDVKKSSLSSEPCSTETSWPPPTVLCSSSKAHCTSSYSKKKKLSLSNQTTNCNAPNESCRGSNLPDSNTSHLKSQTDVKLTQKSKSVVCNNKNIVSGKRSPAKCKEKKQSICSDLVAFQCFHCSYKTLSKLGVKVHIRNKHTDLFPKRRSLHSQNIVKSYGRRLSSLRSCKATKSTG